MGYSETAGEWDRRECQSYSEFERLAIPDCKIYDVHGFPSALESPNKKSEISRVTAA